MAIFGYVDWWVSAAAAVGADMMICIVFARFFLLCSFGDICAGRKFACGVERYVFGVIFYVIVVGVMKSQLMLISW